jgi:hypothetical protein
VAVSGAQTVLTGAEWVLKTFSGPGGRDVVHGAQCTTCKATSGQESNVVRSVGAWAVEHTRAHPRHRGYVSTARTQWRVDPAFDPPVADTAPVQVERGQPGPVDPGSDQPPPQPAHHARSRLWRRAWGRIARYAGPLYLLGLGAAICAFLLAVFLLQKSPQGTRHTVPPAPVHSRISWESAMAKPKKPCPHKELDPVTRKCKKCNAQIYL